MASTITKKIMACLQKHNVKGAIQIIKSLPPYVDGENDAYKDDLKYHLSMISVCSVNKAMTGILDALLSLNYITPSIGIHIALLTGDMNLAKLMVDKIKSGKSYDIIDLYDLHVDSNIDVMKFIIESYVVRTLDVNTDVIRKLLNKDTDYKKLGDLAIPFVENRNERNKVITETLLKDTTLSADVISAICKFTEY